jgi:mono/diheme cytochrome c family protein
MIAPLRVGLAESSPWRCAVRRFQSLVLAVAGLAGVVVLALGCGGHQSPPPGLDEAQLQGWRSYFDLGCAKCHGDNREGTRTAPPLIGLADHWTADRIVSYLSDPNAMVTSDARLARLAERYTLRMPPVSGKAPGYARQANDARLGALAAYLLSDPRDRGD